jgi:zinc-RING finger domain
MFMMRKHVQLARAPNEATCPVCFEADKPESALFTLKCGHSMCDYCLVQMSRLKPNCTCPVCKQTAVPLYAEIPERCSKVSRIDYLDADGNLLGRVDA